MRWRGNVVAAHPSLGVGWRAVPGPGEEVTTRGARHEINELVVTLQPTASVSGRFVSADGTPIRDATVSMTRLKRPSRYSRGDDELDCWLSQLSPRVLTDENGQFEFLGLPQGFGAFIGVTHPSSVEMYAAIATSADVPLGKREDSGGMFRDYPILASPARITADPGLNLTGRVFGPDHEPIASARVALDAMFDREITDDEGRFTLRISNHTIQMQRSRDRISTTLHVFTEPKSGYLSNRIEVSLDDIEAEEPLTVELQRGVLVSGRVVTNDGQPAEQVILSCVGQESSVATSKSDGRFEMLVAPQRHILVVGTAEPGYALPTRIELLRVKSESDYGNWPHLEIDVSDGVDLELPDFVVTRVKPFLVVVSLPDGKPAVGAEVILKDERLETPPPGANFAMPPTIVEKSAAVATDAEGRATIAPEGVTSDRGYLQVKLTDGDKGYDARIPSSEIDGDLVEVTLRPAWIVEGRVLVDGQGVEGAVVSVSESEPFTRTNNGVGFSGLTITNTLRARTDSNGWYRVVVRPEHEYMVSLQRLAEEPLSPGIGYRAVPNVDGRLSVQDFRMPARRSSYRRDGGRSGGKPDRGCKRHDQQTRRRNTSGVLDRPSK